MLGRCVQSVAHVLDVGTGCRNVLWDGHTSQYNLFSVACFARAHHVDIRFFLCTNTAVHCYTLTNAKVPAV